MRMEGLGSFASSIRMQRWLIDISAAKVVRMGRRPAVSTLMPSLDW